MRTDRRLTRHAKRWAAVALAIGLATATRSVTNGSGELIDEPMIGATDGLMTAVAWSAPDAAIDGGRSTEFRLTAGTALDWADDVGPLAAAR